MYKLNSNFNVGSIYFLRTKNYYDQCVEFLLTKSRFKHYEMGTYEQFHIEYSLGNQIHSYWYLVYQINGKIKICIIRVSST